MFGVSTQSRFGGKHPERSVVLSKPPILKAGERRPSQLRRLNSTEMEEFQRRENVARDIILDLKRSAKRLEAEFIGFPLLLNSEEVKTALEKVTVLLCDIYDQAQATQDSPTKSTSDAVLQSTMNSEKTASGRMSPRSQNTHSEKSPQRLSTVTPRVLFDETPMPFTPVERSMYQFGPIVPSVPLGLQSSGPMVRSNVDSASPRENARTPRSGLMRDSASPRENAPMHMTPRTPGIVKTEPSSNASPVTPRTFGPAATPCTFGPPAVVPAPQNSNMLFAQTDGRQNLRTALATQMSKLNLASVSRSASPAPRHTSPPRTFKVRSPPASARMNDAAYETYLSNLRDLLNFTHQEIDTERKRQEELQRAYELRAKKLTDEVSARK